MASSRVERAMSGVLTAAAVLMAAAVARREFISSATPEASAGFMPAYDPGWRQTLDAGVEVGSTAAEVKIVEFLDLECSGCREYQERVLRPVTAQFGAKVSLVVVHLPLKRHRFARAAAEAAECAASQGKIAGFVSVVLSAQDSIGLKPWSSYAAEAGVEELAAFEQCLSSPPTGRIEAGRALAESLGVKATPTIIVNGWRFSVPPHGRELERVIRDLLADRTPFPPSN